MRVCFWSTTFQADNHALADFLANQADFDVTVALDDPNAWARQSVQQLLPFHGRIIPKRDAALRRERYDLLVIDNHVPTPRVAQRVLVVWHGLGWQRDDLATMRSQIKRHVGDVTRPNALFRFQAFGEHDRDYRVQHSRISSFNVIAMGSPYSDWLRPEGALQARFDRSRIQAHYEIDIGRPVIMLGLTWHHGGSLGHWGDEAKLLTRFFVHVRELGASTLVRMHDRHRYDRSYVHMMERLAAAHRGSVMLKWKDESPDSLVDMLVSKALVSNYSSLLNPFYYTERPSIHIDPRTAPGAPIVTRRMFLGRPLRQRIEDPQHMWKLSLEEHGGLQARSFVELLSHVETALRDSQCCRARSREFIAKYITQVDGATCARNAAYLRQWLGVSAARATPTLSGELAP